MGEPGATVQVIVNGQVAATIAINDDGRWSEAVEVSGPGAYVIGARTVNEKGDIVGMAVPTFLLISPPTATRS